MDFSGIFLEAIIFASDFNPFGQVEGLASIDSQIKSGASDAFMPEKLLTCRKVLRFFIDDGGLRAADRMGSMALSVQSS